MRISKTTRVLGAVLFVLVIVAVVLRSLPDTSHKPPPSAPGYYTGPLRGKGDPSKAADENGVPADLPPLEKKAPAASSEVQDAKPKESSKNTKAKTPAPPVVGEKSGSPK